MNSPHFTLHRQDNLANSSESKKTMIQQKRTQTEISLVYIEISIMKCVPLSFTAKKKWLLRKLMIHCNITYKHILPNECPVPDPKVAGSNLTWQTSLHCSSFQTSGAIMNWFEPMKQSMSGNVISCKSSM